MNMDVGMHHAKNRGNKEISLAILSKILAQSCVTPPYIIQAGLRMIVLVSLIGERERANLVVRLARFFCLFIGERERANLVIQQARFFYIYIYIFIYYFYVAGVAHTVSILNVFT